MRARRVRSPTPRGRDRSARGEICTWGVGGVHYPIGAPHRFRSRPTPDSTAGGLPAGCTGQVAARVSTDPSYQACKVGCVCRLGEGLRARSRCRSPMLPCRMASKGLWGFSAGLVPGNSLRQWISHGRYLVIDCSLTAMSQAHNAFASMRRAPRGYLPPVLGSARRGGSILLFRVELCLPRFRNPLSTP